MNIPNLGALKRILDRKHVILFISIRNNTIFNRTITIDHSDSLLDS